MIQYKYQERSSRRNRRKTKLIKHFFLLAALALGAYFLFSLTTGAIDFFQADSTKSKNEKVVSPLESLLKIKKSDSKLSEIIEPILENEKGEYSVFIENLSTGESFQLNSDKKMLAASLYKLWVMGSVYEKLSADGIKRKTVLSEEIPKLNEAFDIATESAELKEGSIAMTVEQALYEMITVSHNYAALLLSRAVRLSSVAEFMEENNYQHSSLNPPTTNARDIAAFFKDLYEKKLVSMEASEEMLELLKQQEMDDRIPKYLPPETVIAHKTGELDGVKHDAGIVYSDKGDYIIVLMSDTGDQTNAAEVEARISGAVYDYFQKR